MWGAIDKAPKSLLSLHLAITNALADLDWNRSQIWDSRTSTQSWQLMPNLVIAFDVVPGAESTSLTLVVRQKDWVQPVRAAFESSSLTTPPVNSSKPERMTLGTYPAPAESGNDELGKQIAEEIRRTRSALSDLVRPSESWTDPETGLTLRHSVKPDRKECPELIFLFTSIRTNHDWLDFRGPLGPTLASNRARIVFVEDVFTPEYTYHLAIGGDTAVRTATVNFVRHYVEANGYAWDRVTLAGMSKGGTAALVVGALLPSCTVVALAPQLKLGRYLLGSRTSTLENITGHTPDEAAAEAVDDLMWSSLWTGQGPRGIRTCYVLTSDGDPDCTDGLERFTALFDSPERVVVSTDHSAATPTHHKTVLHLSPVFVSLLGVISAGLRPAGWR